MVNIVVGFPMVNAGSLYINGLGINWLTGTTLSISAGAARDSTNQDDIVLPVATTLNAAANGVNGLDTGALGVSLFYYVYVIGSSLGANPEINNITQVSTMAANSVVLNGTVISEGIVPQPTWSVTNNIQPAVLLSLSATAPLLPEGYDMFRRIGTVLTSGASAILAFWQDGNYNGTNRKMWYDAPIAVLAATAAAAFTAQDLSMAVPAIALQGKNTEVQVQVDLLPNAPAEFVEIRPTGSAAAAGNVKLSGPVAAVHQFDQLQVIAALNAAVPPQASIDWVTDAASTVAITVSAYTDKL